jgi:hypothetical protein
MEKNMSSVLLPETKYVSIRNVLDYAVTIADLMQ